MWLSDFPLSFEEKSLSTNTVSLVYTILWNEIKLLILFKKIYIQCFSYEIIANNYQGGQVPLEKGDKY